MLNVLLVGCGKMGGALAQRWEDQNICQQLVIVDPQVSEASLAEKHVKSFEHIPTDFKPHVVVFAVKPQTLPDIAAKYKKYDGALFLSIAAGKPVAFFETHLGAKAKIIRSMPNTPAAIGRGITVAFANSPVSKKEKEWASTLLGAVGKVMWVDKEDLLNAVTALSGSGPAYVFLMIEALTQAGINIGLAPDLAEKLARETVIGSAALADENATTPASKLRENVTSPGGTTEAALKVLMATPGLQDLFTRALAAAQKRAEELSH